MHSLIKVIILNETSYNVVFLHQVLVALGLPVAQEEVARHTAGRDTLEKVRALQKQLNVRVDESTVVDAATAAAIAEALDKRGFTDASRSFAVNGAVKLHDGSLKKQQRLLAFDLDLRGVAVYRQVTTLAEIEKSGGFEFLGLTTSDNRGNYSLTFYDWQYRRAERKKADVVVFAVDEDKEGSRITGRSRLINSEDYSDQGLVRNLDVLITETDIRTEYEILMDALTAFLKESETSLREISTSSEQLIFTARELDVDQECINIAATAELLNESGKLSHELLYGLGRQEIRLEWTVLYRKHEDELRAAITKSVDQRIIRAPNQRVLLSFLRTLQDSAARKVLDDKGADGVNTLNAMLSNALPQESQRLSFLNAISTFKDSDFRKFWREHLPAQAEFKERPELVSSLLLTQQLALLTGNHQALVNELQVKRKITTAQQLLDLEKDDWLKLIKQTGVPEFVEGTNEADKLNAYAELIQTILNAAFPTRRIARMVAKKQLPIARREVSQAVAAFLTNTPHFDFATSRIHDFEKEIKAAIEQSPNEDQTTLTKKTSRIQAPAEGTPAKATFAEVRSELMKIQRVFQVSTTPEAMTALMNQNLHSAYSIANIPPQSFIKTYADELGGESAAFAIHQRASHISLGSEMTATHILDYSQGLAPECAMGSAAKDEVMAVLQQRVPNYSELFGGPDLCECEHCRSVYSAAAYLVDLLRFLWRSVPNQDSPQRTPLDMLAARRPDLLHLPLTCENTNTIIPYIDLANEVMEYYAAHDSLNGFEGYDTGEATVAELRANPQHFNLAAYSNIKDAKYPFTLPYHQPLDVIRIYSDHLKVSRYEVMKAVNPLPSNKIANAIAAESLRLSEEEYKILTGFDYAGAPHTISLNECFGYSAGLPPTELEKLKSVPEFLRRSGVAYTDLIELVKSQFINPFQNTLDFLQKIFSFASTKPDVIYSQLKAGTFDPATEPNVMVVLNATKITPAKLAGWITDHFPEFQQVITLFEPQSRCDLDTTELRTIEGVYEPLTSAGIAENSWSKIHRFIRLWRKLGWTIHETDLVLTAINESDITPATIGKLESVTLLRTATKISLSQLSVFWGNIDSYGNKSLYKQLFLNKAAQQIDPAFEVDGWGDYLQDNTQTLGAHQSAILAAFRISEEDLAAILDVARIIDNSTTATTGPRPIDIKTDILNLGNLSTIYRYVVLARTLKMSVSDLCKLIALFGAIPFSIWDNQLGKFINIAPDETYKFYKLALATKEAGFKPSVLEYITQGTLAADSKIGLSKEKSLQTAKSIRDVFVAIDQSHPDIAPSLLTPELITAKLTLTFQPEIVSRFIGILDGTASFETFTDKNLVINLPGSAPDNFLDLDGLLARLNNQVDPVSKFLWNAFSNATQQVLSDVLATQAQKKAALINELNGILSTGPLYNAQLFAGVTLSSETLALLSQKPTGPNLVRLNELLLQDAYPQELGRISLSNKYNYVKISGRLSCAGIMSDTEQTALKSLANITPNFETAIDQLYSAPGIFLSIHFSDIFTDLPEANAILLNHPEQNVAATLEEKLLYVYDHFIPVLKSKLRRDAITHHIAALIGLSEQSTALLIADKVESLIAALSTAGFSGSYFNDSKWQKFLLSATDSNIDFSWGQNAPKSLVQDADDFSVRWETYLAAPASDDYTLVVDVDGADEGFKLFLDDTQILEKNSAATSWSVAASLNAARLHSLRLDYAEHSLDAGVRLQWKRDTTALEVIPASVAYPKTVLDAFVTQVDVYHRAAKFIGGFELSEVELNYLIEHKADFGNINFEALNVGDWERINDYTTLRNAVPQNQASLTDVFKLANISNQPLAFLDDVKTLLSLATAWDEPNLQFQMVHFSLSRADFRNEIILKRILQVMKIAARTGLSAETIAEWGAAETDFNDLNDTAQLLKNTVRARYEEQDWLDLAGKLNNTIRENQQQALIAYLLTNEDIHKWGATDADGLFEYFLIDVQMGACMDTSRIVQATLSVQLFVNRCLLNLESETSSGAEKGVSPAAIDKARWEWMKNYRVWEANRKVFLYPENWLEPDWRNDRSEFFKNLESYLVQNDITDRTVEQGFRNYLADLNEVANLEVCGIHKETHSDGKLKYLHVFARTHNAPYKFFYRRWNEFRKWSAWEKMAVDIPCVENGDDSGVHLIPVLWKKRLFLFWPEFRKVAEAPGNDNTTVDAAFEKKISELKPTTSWEIRLAWSEYVDEKWSSKQVSKEFIKIWPDLWGITSESKIRWVYLIGSKQQLEIRAHFLDTKTFTFAVWRELGTFHLSDITSRLNTDNSSWLSADGWRGYELSFMNYAKSGKLQLLGDDYLTADVSHKVLVTSTRQDYVQRLNGPFFFSDSLRTYFVRPVDISFIEWVRVPDQYAASFPGLVADNQLRNDSAVIEQQSPAKLVLRGPASRPIEVLPASAAIATANDTASSQSFGVLASTQSAFGGLVAGVAPLIPTMRNDIGLEFHTFYHPFSSEYVKNLNQEGLSGLLSSDTEIASDNGATFENAYNPNFTNGFVQKPADFATRTYYKENVCFDVYGANSIYNWELFFHAPLYIAIRLSKNGKFEEALKWFHYIFDPTTDKMPSSGESAVSRYWKVLPFKTTQAVDLEEFLTNDPTAQASINEWRDHPFDPHLIASGRPLAYMKQVVMKYVENLIAWGDSLFRQDTMESVSEALQIYVIANHVLGRRPEFVPKRGEIKVESFASLQSKLDDFSNALIELENLFPFSSSTAISQSSPGANLLGVGSALYFCIPPNEKLLEYWDTAADRLFKIRHCQNIEGVERHLALFSPPIDPGALIQAASQGLNLGSILADLSSPSPIYRFSFLIQKANEFCADVKALGSALLAAIEKKDAEALSRLRASQESQMLELMTAIKERQVLDAKVSKENLEKARETAVFRFQHYVALLQNESISVPTSPTINGTLTADSQLPADTNVPIIVMNVDDSLVDSHERGVKLIRREQDEMDRINKARDWQVAAQSSEGLAAIAHLYPNMSADGKPYGLGAGLVWGGTLIGNALNAVGKVFDFIGGFSSHQAILAAKMAAYVRREQDWGLQLTLAARDVIGLDKQITSADIRVQVAKKELENHKQQIENAKANDEFLKNKFTNQELYQWMKEQLFALYKQSYNLAYDMAKKAEKAYKFEMGMGSTNFIQYGYWDNSKQGLVAGDKLQLALRQLENSYLDENLRELELSKSISLARLDPLALIQLRETGKCYLSVPEELFDFDFPGHYFRRLKGARLSIPCVVGPYSSVSCSLHLLNNTIRINTNGNQYQHENDEGLLIDDDRFRTNHVPVTAIATSSAQNDSGMFEFNFRDERYLPFERAGAISEWQIELSTEKELRQFDYSTISDVILHLDYTAREGGGLFKEKATKYLKDFINNATGVAEAPLVQMFSLRHEFSTEWYRFLNPAIANAEQELTFTLGMERFPFFAQDRDVVVTQMHMLARCTGKSGYHVKLSYNQGAINQENNTLRKQLIYDELNVATMEPVALDIALPITLKLTQLPLSPSSTPDYGKLVKDPPEVEDIYLVIHYKLKDLAP